MSIFDKTSPFIKEYDVPLEMFGYVEGHNVILSTDLSILKFESL